MEGLAPSLGLGLHLTGGYDLTLVRKRPYAPHAVIYGSDALQMGGGPAEAIVDLGGAPVLDSLLLLAEVLVLDHALIQLAHRCGPTEFLESCDGRPHQLVVLRDDTAGHGSILARSPSEVRNTTVFGSVRRGRVRCQDRASACQCQHRAISLSHPPVRATSRGLRSATRRRAGSVVPMSCCCSSGAASFLARRSARTTTQS